MTNRKTKEIQFKIDHLDRFGQGVFKDPATNLVTFIPGTLPEEKGTALITKSKGKVQFARLKHLEKNSDSRIVPECEYFNKCSGCQYWMTSREKESEYKQETYRRNLRNTFPQLPDDLKKLNGSQQKIAATIAIESNCIMIENKKLLDTVINKITSSKSASV